VGAWVAEHVIGRRFIEPIASRTLRRFKALAEAAPGAKAEATP
jgi:hypothetical protein